jgi:hypothetical protein
LFKDHQEQQAVMVILIQAVAVDHQELQGAALQEVQEQVLKAVLVEHMVAAVVEHMF